MVDKGSGTTTSPTIQRVVIAQGDSDISGVILTRGSDGFRGHDWPPLVPLSAARLRLTSLSLQVELWDRQDSHIRWVIAATSSTAIADAAFDVAVALHPNERLMLRQGIRVVRKHEPG